MPETLPVIVVVEDDPSMRGAIKRILLAGGYVAVMFESAEEAIASQTLVSADCLVLDVRLPGMSGFELYDQFADRDHHPPAVFITAHDEPADIVEAARLGAKGFLQKPFSGRALLDALTQAIAGERNHVSI